MKKQRHTLRSAVYLFLKKDSQILLLLRKGTGYQDGNYSVPSGHIDGNEKATAALIREVKEEIGVNVKKEDLEFAHVIHRLSEPAEYIDFYFTTTKWFGKPKNLETDKHGEMKWVSINTLPLNMVPEVRSAIENYLKDIPFSEFDWD